MLKVAAIALAITALCLPPDRLWAQHGNPTRVPATVVFADQAVQAEPFVVHRRTDAEVDVIVLRSDATVEQLSDAVRALMTIRQLGGDTASSPGIMRMRPRPVGPGRAAAHPVPWAGRVLADLKKAEPRDVPGLGRVRAVKIWLPRQRIGR